jgi:murein DD-endopeptidase MepM/ murein hydrolase activator NlpD
MTDALDSKPSAPALTRRELRERERAAERAALLAQRAAAEAPAVEAEAPEVVAEVEKPAEAQPLTRREIRERERAAAREAQLAAATQKAAEVAAKPAPVLVAVTDAPAPTVAAAPVAVESDTVEIVEAESADEHVTNFEPEVVETLNPSTGLITIAPVISLEEVRTSRAEFNDNPVPAAPADEPEIPAAFLRVSDDANATVLPFRTRVSGAGRLGGSMVALSFLAGTVVLGTGSAAAIGALNSQGDESAQAADTSAAEADVAAQTLSVDAQAHEHSTTRVEDATAVTSIGTAAAANLANGVKLPDSSTYTNDITANVQWPFPMGVQLTDGYGPRNGPAGTSAFHGGQDLTPGEGTPIGSIADGVVKRVDDTGSSSLGYFIEVEHVIEGQHVTSLYAHLDPSTIVVEEGQEVQVGDELAGVGNTGISTGPHLHLEVHVNGQYVNPVTFLEKVNVEGVKTEMPTELTANVGLGADEKLDDAASTALIDELFVSKIDAE